MTSNTEHSDNAAPQHNIMLQMLRRRSTRSSEQEQLRYLPQSVKMDEATTPHLIKTTMFWISFSVLAFIAWAVIAPIQEITRASGNIIPQGYTQVVQHLEGGIVTEILTEEGEKVKAGQILLKIDDGDTVQSLSEVQKKMQSLLLRSERLLASVEERDPDFSSISNLDKDEAAQQMAIFNSMLAARDSERDVIIKKIASEAAEIEVLDARLKKISGDLKLSQEALLLKGKLHDQGYSPRLTVIKYEQDVARLIGDHAETSRQIDKSTRAIAELQSRTKSLKASWHDEAYKELDDTKLKINKASEDLKKIDARNKRLVVRSPVYGAVKGLYVNTIGSVITPGETLMEIVPLKHRLIIEARLSPADIGHVHIGQKARVKVGSYDFSRYGTIDGVLNFLSVTSFNDGNGKPYYKARITLAKNYVGNDPSRFIIMPGMTVEADIITGEKTVFEYLLRPIHLSIKNAFTER